MSKNNIILVVVIAIIVIAGAIWWQTSSIASPNSNGIKAVFLTNGQVYFGSIANESTPFVKLENVFYLQVSQTLQPVPSGQAPQQKIDLVKLGNELHGPNDVMRINRDQILFIEDLKTDSQISKAIANFKPQNAAPQQ